MSTTIALDSVTLENVKTALQQRIDALDPLDAWTLLEALEHHSPDEILAAVDPMDEELTPEDHAAIDAGLRSARCEPLLTSEEVRTRIAARRAE